MFFKISADNFILEISKWWWRAIGWRVVIRPMSKYYSLSNDCTYMSTRVWPPRTSRATQPTKTLYSKRCMRLTSFFRILMEKNRLKWHELNHSLGIIFFSISLFNNWVSYGFYYCGAIYYFGKLNIFFPEQTLMLEMLLIVIAPLILLCTIYIWNAGTNCTFVFFKIH